MFSVLPGLEVFTPPVYDMNYYSTLCGPAALLGGPAIRRPAAALNAAGSDPAAVRPRAGRRALGAHTHLFRHRTYRCRALILLALWTVAYVAVYSPAGGPTSLLITPGYPRAEAGIIPAVGIFGLFLSWAAPTCGSPGCAGHRGLDGVAGRGSRRSAERCGMRSGRG